MDNYMKLFAEQRFETLGGTVNKITITRFPVIYPYIAQDPITAIIDAGYDGMALGPKVVREDGDYDGYTEYEKKILGL